MNEGDIGAISTIMENLGFFGACLVQKSTRRIIAGKHRWISAQGEGKPDVPVLWLDVDDDTATRIMLADNRAARLGHDDDRALADLLTELAEGPKGLVGTGFDGDALDELLADLNKIGEPLDASPQLDGLEYRIVVDCMGEEHQRELLERFETEGLTVKALTS